MRANIRRIARLLREAAKELERMGKLSSPWGAAKRIEAGGTPDPKIAKKGSEEWDKLGVRLWEVIKWLEVIEDPDKIYEEVQKWLDAGFAAGDAAVWYDYGFTPEEAKEWIEAGINDPVDAWWWRKKLGMDLKQVKKWINAGINDVSEVEKWVEMGITDPEEAKRRDKGENPTRILSRRHSLRRRYLRR